MKIETATDGTCRDNCQKGVPLYTQIGWFKKMVDQKEEGKK